MQRRGWFLFWSGSRRFGGLCSLVMTPEERLEAEVKILEANREFYRAFSRGDFGAMNELWAKHSPVACLHPGATLVSGRAAVLGGWRQILAGAPAWHMVSREPTVHLLGDVAFVTCLEANGDQPAHLVATNIFVYEDRRWRMVHHQAGPLSSPQPVRAPRDLSN
jgi:ketosteroid isomerase-like protein